MGDSKGNDLITSIVIGLIILGLGLVFLKRSGKLDEIKRTFQELSKNSE